MTFLPPDIPRVMTTAYIASLLGDGWDSARVLKIMRASGVGRKIGRIHYVTKTELRATLPAFVAEMEIEIAERGGG